MPTLYLHIGAKKTGSTTLQAAIKNNIPAFTERGVFVSRLCGKVEDKLVVDHYLGRQPEVAGPAVTAWYRAAEAFLAQGGRAAIMTAESLSDLRPPEIEALQAEIPRIFDQVRVVYYVRRQDLAAVSHYSTALRGGGASKELLSRSMGARGRRGFSYGRVASDWAAVFGRPNVTVRRYVERHAAPAGWDVVADFLAILGLASLAEGIRPPPQNTALTRIAAAHLRRYNEMVKAGRLVREKDHPARIIRHFQEQGDQQRVPYPARDLAYRFFRSFDKDNELLREAFFPELAAVFDDNFDQYPDTQVDIDSFVDAAELERILAAERV